MMENLNLGRYLRIGGYGLILFYTVNANAWHDLGHMMIGQLASEHIAAQHPDVSGYMETLRKKAQEYFARDFDIAQLSDTAKAASFLDTYSSKHRQTKSWHYINGPYVPAGAYSKVNETALCNAYRELPNAPIEIAVSLGVLHSSRESIQAGNVSDEAAEAYVKILHLVGDAHQPLHNLERFDGQNPKGDRGGNGFPVSGVPGVDNLHSLWDSMGMKFGEVRWNDKEVDTKLAEYLKEVKAFIGTDPRYPSDILALSTVMDPWDLTSGLYLSGKKLVYEGIGYNQNVSGEYQKKVQEYSQYLVYMAGQTLANMLVYALTDQGPEEQTVGSLKQYNGLSRARVLRLNHANHIAIHQKRLAVQKTLEGKEPSEERVTYSYWKSYWKAVNDWVDCQWPDQRP